MIEIILLVVIAFLCGLIVYLDYFGRKERSKLLNMIAAKNNKELVELTLSENTEVKVAPQPDPLVDSGLVDMANLSDSDATEAILKNAERIREEEAEEDE